MTAFYATETKCKETRSVAYSFYGKLSTTAK